MSTGFSRLVVSRFARTRSDVRWLIKAARRHRARRREGRDVAYMPTRNLRLALGQFLLCAAYDAPVKTILAPFAAACVYLAAVLYIIFGK
jgi:hypothetical protein